MKELKFNIKFMLKRKEFYLAILFTLVINFIHAFLCVKRVLNDNRPFEKIISGEYQSILLNVDTSFTVLTILVFPILLALIFSDTNVLDKERKTTNILYTRINLKTNIIVRSILSFFTAFIISLVGFMFNYLLLRLIFGSGNMLTYSQNVAFSMENNNLFLSSFMESNPFIYILLICFSVSLILGLLSVLSYLMANIINKKVITYFIPVIFLLLWEVIIKFFKINLSFVEFMQPLNVYSISKYMSAIMILLFINVILLIPQVIRKDTLV